MTSIFTVSAATTLFSGILSAVLTGLTLVVIVATAAYLIDKAMNQEG